jgi:hypothetical protein
MSGGRRKTKGILVCSVAAAEYGVSDGVTRSAVKEYKQTFFLPQFKDNRIALVTCYN